MKAQYIIENINFERGGDPRETLGLGQQFLEVFEMGTMPGSWAKADYLKTDETEKVLKSLSDSKHTERKTLNGLWVSYNLDNGKSYNDNLDFILTVDFMQDILGRKFNYLKYDGDYFPIDHLVEN